MQKSNKWIFPIIILLLIIIYSFITIPHNFIKKALPIMAIHVDYHDYDADSIIPNHLSTMYLLETNEDINNFSEVIKNYRYRNYFFKPYNGSHKPASFMMIDIYYNEQEFDTIYINSDGLFSVNSERKHIGYWWNDQAKQMYETIYDQLKDKFNTNYGPYDIKLPNGYALIQTSAHNLTLNKQIDDNNWGEAILPTEIVEIAWDDKYILTKQVGLRRRNPDNSNDTYELSDESKVSYWILEIENGTVYGPLNDIEFIKKKEELSISNNTVLKKLFEYKR